MSIEGSGGAIRIAAQPALARVDSVTCSRRPPFQVNKHMVAKDAKTHAGAGDFIDALKEAQQPRPAGYPRLNIGRGHGDTDTIYGHEPKLRGEAPAYLCKRWVIDRDERSAKANLVIAAPSAKSPLEIATQQKPNDLPQAKTRRKTKEQRCPGRHKMRQSLRSLREILYTVQSGEVGEGSFKAAVTLDCPDLFDRPHLEAHGVLHPLLSSFTSCLRHHG